MAENDEKTEKYLSDCLYVADMRSRGTSNYRAGLMLRMPMDRISRMAEDHELAVLADKHLKYGTVSELRRYAKAARFRGIKFGRAASAAGVSRARLGQAGGGPPFCRRPQDPFGMFDAMLAMTAGKKWAGAGEVAYGIYEGRAASARTRGDAKRMGLECLLDLLDNSGLWRIDKTARERILWARETEIEIWRRLV